MAVVRLFSRLCLLIVNKPLIDKNLTFHGKIISAIYVNKSPNQLECYLGLASIYLQKLNSTCITL